MTQPAILISLQGLETIGEKLRWKDLVVPSISKEPNRAEVSVQDLSS